MNYKRKRPRTAPVTCYAPTFTHRRRGKCTTPAWWNLTFHTRPKRRAETRVLRAIMLGADPDGVLWPVSSHKPHVYYW